MKQTTSIARHRRGLTAFLSLLFLCVAGIAPGPLHSYALAELYTAKGSPRVELDPLVKLLTEAPELPLATAAPAPALDVSALYAIRDRLAGALAEARAA